MNSDFVALILFVIFCLAAICIAKHEDVKYKEPVQQQHTYEGWL